ncbi:GIY-YIG nuclease family protein [Candidatus Gottesmanbacteria bacterium]|nr:GIY-YIG nuclease family protein [Candidatus Gottesmanbacteria bacterium]
MWHVYILLCENKSLYTGITDNPKRRFQDHRKGKGGRYTRLYKPIKIVYLEKLPDKSSALKREIQIKGWTRKKKIEVLKLNI